MSKGILKAKTSQNMYKEIRHTETHTQRPQEMTNKNTAKHVQINKTTQCMIHNVQRNVSTKSHIKHPTNRNKRNTQKHTKRNKTSKNS